MTEAIIIALALAVVWLIGIPQRLWMYWRYERAAYRKAIEAQRIATEQQLISMRGDHLGGDT